MGEVYRARDPSLRRDVAVKVLPEPVGDDGERQRRFEREARAAAELSLWTVDVGTGEDRLLRALDIDPSRRPTQWSSVVVTPDAMVHAWSWISIRSDLYVVDGLR
jgi:serine/threonine protein kinase